MSENNKPATWRVVVAFIFDLFFSFFVLGYIVALFTGAQPKVAFR